MKNPFRRKPVTLEQREHRRKLKAAPPARWIAPRQGGYRPHGESTENPQPPLGGGGVVVRRSACRGAQ